MTTFATTATSQSEADRRASSHAATHRPESETWAVISTGNDGDAFFYRIAIVPDERAADDEAEIAAVVCAAGERLVSVH